MQQTNDFMLQGPLFLERLKNGFSLPSALMTNKQLSTPKYVS